MSNGLLANGGSWGSRDIDHRTRGARVRAREAIEAKPSELRLPPLSLLQLNTGGRAVPGCAIFRIAASGSLHGSVGFTASVICAPFRKLAAMAPAVPVFAVNASRIARLGETSFSAFS